MKEGDFQFQDFIFDFTDKLSPFTIKSTQTSLDIAGKFIINYPDNMPDFQINLELTKFTVSAQDISIDLSPQLN